MALIGELLGHFRITAKLGEGGMGEVYRAEDTRLGREVAVKVLPEAFAADADRMARFGREARVLASLNHPLIAGIYEVGEAEADGPRVHYLVMELAAGESLAQRLARGAVPPEEALPVALRISEALEAAHERGIVHRDLKPANIMLTPSGGVKILDFGLAKALEGDPPAPGASVATQSPTLTAGGTRMGVILGTAAYMSPEQARGLVVDRRADVWSFGCVLYEMLTGERSFAEETVTDTLAAVLKSDVDLDRLPPETPPSICRLLARCLDKDPRTRLRDIGEARVAIERYLADPGSEAGAGALGGALAGLDERRASPWRRALPWGIAALALLLAGAAWLTAPKPAPELPVLRSEVRLPTARYAGSQVALSPVGDLMVYVAPFAERRRLRVRRYDELKDTVLAGTEEAQSPFFSPGGEWIGFFADGMLKKVSVTGGAPLELASAPNGRGGSWTADDRIVFAPLAGGLLAVSANGGEVREITRLEEGERSHRWPHVLPGGAGVLFTSNRTGTNFDAASIEVVDLDSGERTVLARGGSYPLFTPSGHLLYTRQGTVFAAPFDARRRALSRSPVPVLQEVAYRSVDGGAEIAVGRELLVYRRGADTEFLGQPVLVTPGEEPEPLMEPRNVHAARWSPGGGRIAFGIDDAGSMDIWVHELGRGVLSRFTYDGQNNAPVWSPDGQWIAFTSSRSGTPNLYRKRADGSGEAGRLTTSEKSQYAEAWSPDGRWLVFRQEERDTRTDILRLDLETPGSKPEALVRTPHAAGGADISPDGRWLAYFAQESSLWEVYVRRFGPGGGRWQMSTEGGYWPRWSASGDRLYFLHGEGVWAVEVAATETSLRPSRPEEVIIPPGNWMGLSLSRKWDLHAGRFLLVRQAEADAEIGNQLVLVTNWLTELERLVPTN